MDQAFSRWTWTEHGERVGWHIFFCRSQSSDRGNTGTAHAGSLKSTKKTTGCGKPGVQARRALSKRPTGGGLGKGHVWKAARSLRQRQGRHAVTMQLPTTSNCPPAQGSGEGHAPGRSQANFSLLRNVQKGGPAQSREEATWTASSLGDAGSGRG
ncbi:hypothetical protein AOQ84DRAFT_224199 [Glonium stellatum]|uniref:Uncharacterized protein n=1 Tax=Glonium stellatum TaxID=574774 RepID=A0A8E2JYH2_9PEZI|nr:hypothetical protein AOQ84DRAFT_224199 [Glonium stellatum]